MCSPFSRELIPISNLNNTLTNIRRHSRPSPRVPSPWMDVFICPRSVRQRCSQYSSVRTPAGPAQCNLSFETPSGHRSKGAERGGRGRHTEVRGQHESEDKRSPIITLDVVAAKEKKILSGIHPQCQLFLFQTNKTQQCMCCRSCRARLLCEVMCDIGRSRRARTPTPPAAIFSH